MRYHYDALGNVTSIHDSAKHSIFFRNQRVDPRCDYTYDSLYRLIRATGREHLGQTNGTSSPPTATGPFTGVNVDSPGDGSALGSYKELYKYDVAGNLLSLKHSSSDPRHIGW